MKRIFKTFLIGILLGIAFAMPVSASSGTESPLSLNVTYSELVCGQSITFTLNATGGDGSYKYRTYFVKLAEPNEAPFDVIDPSKFSFQTGNTFQYTFYASGQYQLRFTVMGKVNGTFSTKNANITINLSDVNYPSVQDKVTQVAQACLDAGCQTDYEKALWLHDWLVENCDYDYANYQYCNAEGALCRKKGTCEAYHRAYCKLLNACGIENGRSQSLKANHVWTAVKLDGEWYQVDVTHDDYGAAGSFYRHLYFGLSEKITRMTSLNRDDFTGNATENAHKNNYFIKSGEISTWMNPFLADIQSNLNAKKCAFDLEITSSNPPSVDDVLYSLVAYALSDKTYTAGGKTPDVSVSYVKSSTAGVKNKLHFVVDWPVEETTTAAATSTAAASKATTAETATTTTKAATTTAIETTTKAAATTTAKVTTIATETATTAAEKKTEIPTEKSTEKITEKSTQESTQETVVEKTEIETETTKETTQETTQEITQETTQETTQVHATTENTEITFTAGQIKTEEPDQSNDFSLWPVIIPIALAGIVVVIIWFIRRRR